PRGWPAGCRPRPPSRGPWPPSSGWRPGRSGSSATGGQGSPGVVPAHRRPAAGRSPWANACPNPTDAGGARPNAAPPGPTEGSTAEERDRRAGRRGGVAHAVGGGGRPRERRLLAGGDRGPLDLQRRLPGAAAHRLEREGARRPAAAPAAGHARDAGGVGGPHRQDRRRVDLAELPDVLVDGRPVGGQLERGTGRVGWRRRRARRGRRPRLGRRRAGGRGRGPATAAGVGAGGRAAGPTTCGLPRATVVVGAGTPAGTVVDAGAATVVEGVPVVRTRVVAGRSGAGSAAVSTSSRGPDAPPPAPRAPMITSAPAAAARPAATTLPRPVARARRAAAPSALPTASSAAPSSFGFGEAPSSFSFGEGPSPGPDGSVPTAPSAWPATSPAASAAAP